MKAYELLAYLHSGLALWEQNEDGELEWVGTNKDWDNYERLLAQYEQETYEC